MKLMKACITLKIQAQNLRIEELGKIIYVLFNSVNYSILHMHLI